MMMMNGEESASQTMDSITAKLEWCMTRLEKMTTHDNCDDFQKNHSPKSTQSRNQFKDEIDGSDTEVRDGLSFLDGGFKRLRSSSIKVVSMVNRQQDYELPVMAITKAKMESEVKELDRGYQFLMKQIAETKMNCLEMNRNCAEMVEPLKSVVKILGNQPVNNNRDGSSSSLHPDSTNYRFQVPNQNWEQQLNDIPLGYRPGPIPVATGDSMLKRIEMPSCDGSHILEWLVDIEHFFTVGHFREEDKLEIVAFTVEGKVKKWLAWVLKRGGFRDWSDFKHKLLERFDHATRCFSVKEISQQTVSSCLNSVDSSQLYEKMIMVPETNSSTMEGIDEKSVGKEFLMQTCGAKGLVSGEDHDAEVILQQDTLLVFDLGGETETRVDDSLEHELQLTTVSNLTTGCPLQLQKTEQSGFEDHFDAYQLAVFDEYYDHSKDKTDANDAQRCLLQGQRFACLVLVISKHQLYEPRKNFSKSWPFKYKSGMPLRLKNHHEQLQILDRLLLRYANSYFISLMSVAVAKRWYQGNMSHCFKGMKLLVLDDTISNIWHKWRSKSVPLLNTAEQSVTMASEWECATVLHIRDASAFMTLLIPMGFYQQISSLHHHREQSEVIWQRFCFELQSLRSFQKSFQVLLLSTSLGSSLFSREEVYHRLHGYRKQRDRTELKRHEQTTRAHSKSGKQQSVRWLLFHKQSQVHSVISQSDALAQDGAEKVVWLVLQIRNIVFDTVFGIQVMLQICIRVIGMCHLMGKKCGKTKADASSEIIFVYERLYKTTHLKKRVENVASGINGGATIEETKCLFFFFTKLEGKLVLVGGSIDRHRLSYGC